MFFKEAIKKKIPKSVKNVAQRLFRVGSYPNWKSIINNDPDIWWSALSNAKGGPKVLIATSVGSHRSGNITESALAVALTLRGVDVHVLLCDKMLPACIAAQYAITKDMRKFVDSGPSGAGYCSGCFFQAARMYKDLGIKIYPYSELVSSEEKCKAEQISKEIPFEEIDSFKYNGVAIGEHAMAGALRFYCTGDLDGQEYAETVLRRYFYASLLTMFAMQRLIDTHDYCCSVFVHGIYVPHGILGEVARQRNVRVVNWNTSYRQKRFIFTHHDTYHHMMLSEPVSNWINMPWNDELEKQIMDYLESREAGTRDWQQFNENANPALEAAVKELKIDFTKPTIGLLPNVVWDAQLHYRANAFKNLMEWAIKTIEYFIRHPDLQLLIRVHPAEIRRFSKSRQPLIREIRKVFPTLPPNIYIIPPESKISTYAVMQQCNAVLIYGTKTGVELTARGIPVIVAGEAWIRNKGLTMDASSRKEYFSILDKLSLLKRMDAEQVCLARRYAYHFFYRRGIYLPFMTKSKDSMSFQLGIKRVSELGPGKGIGLDVICNGILEGKEFIYPAELQAESDE